MLSRLKVAPVAKVNFTFWGIDTLIRLVLFWVTTIARYLLTSCGSLVMSTKITILAHAGM